MTALQNERISDDELFAAFLLEHGRIDNAAVERARRLQGETGDRLTALLTKLGLISERDMAGLLADFLGVEVVGRDDYPEEPVLEDALSKKFVREFRILPLEDAADRARVAMADPLDAYVRDAIRLAVGKEVAPLIGLPADIEAAYERLYRAGTSTVEEIFADDAAENLDSAAGDIERLRDLAGEAPVIRFVNHLIRDAVEMRASDIHVEPFDDKVRIRYRIDGALREVEGPPPRLRAAVTSRIKLMAKLNIAETRLPQDGRIRLVARGRQIDLRVSTVPTMHGESVVLRILDREGLALDFDTLGYAGEALDRYLRLLDEPTGILLVTGPTGSGKTTTLYTSLTRLNTIDRKVLTVEDPVEYELSGINQLQVKPSIGLDFANALRSLVRQDPDVIMIGEIRDLETAEIAGQAALTGHKVLSTLHTNDAPSSVTRLLDMGVEDYLVTSTVNGIIAQRLVRRLCTDCREPRPILPELVEQIAALRARADGEIVAYHPVGCPACAGTGYLGRTAIHEILIMSDEIRRLVLQHAESRLIQRTAIEEGMKTMFDCGIAKVVDGETTIDEVLRVTRDI